MNTHKLYALDFAFYSSSGVYGFEAQCQMIKKIGYDGLHFSAWDGLRWDTVQQIVGAKARHGIEVTGIYTVLDLRHGAADPRNSGILKMLETLQECTTVNLSIRGAGAGIQPGSAEGLAPVSAWLKDALAICERRGFDLLLYPHINFWMDTHSVAVSLAQDLDHPNLGIVFTGFHWYAQEGGNPLTVLQACLPYLRQVHLSGSRRSPLGFGKVATIEPLDVGECDNLAIIGLLKRLGYAGPMGYLGWDEGGNPFNKLKRSLHALQEMIALSDENPSWCGHLD
ncbi:MAG: xylose isomerase [Burkholderiales bacterium 28-67-8]|nr:MAG: xylose isomerase [Burkholderiales bacterium 28-67-8]